MLAFAVSGLFAGLGGALLAHRDTNVVANPFGFQLALVFILMTVVGGLRNRAGVVLGGAFFALLRNGELLEILHVEQPVRQVRRSTSPPRCCPLVLGPHPPAADHHPHAGRDRARSPPPSAAGSRGGRFRFAQGREGGADHRCPSLTTGSRVLETRDVSIRFGGVQALRDVNLRVDQWEIVGIIGPNGAGKTTLFNCITGFYAPTSGRVRYRGQDVTDLAGAQARRRSAWAAPSRTSGS